MTRRERHIRILDSFGKSRTRYFIESRIARRGLAVFTDEAIEEITRDLLSSHRRQQQYNREYRERRKA